MFLSILALLQVLTVSGGYSSAEFDENINGALKNLESSIDSTKQLHIRDIKVNIFHYPYAYATIVYEVIDK